MRGPEILYRRSTCESSPTGLKTFQAPVSFSGCPPENIYFDISSPDPSSGLPSAFAFRSPIGRKLHKPHQRSRRATVEIADPSRI